MTRGLAAVSAVVRPMISTGAAYSGCNKEGDLNVSSVIRIPDRWCDYLYTFLFSYIFSRITFFSQISGSHLLKYDHRREKNQSISLLSSSRMSELSCKLYEWAVFYMVVIEKDHFCVIFSIFYEK